MIEYNPESKEDSPSPGRPGVCVVGIGGAGANVLDRIALENLVDIELLSMNTDIRALTNAVSSRKLQLGVEITRGLGAGGDPELGREAARSEEQAIREALEGREMVFLCVGLGGGTGSGAGPYVARIAKAMGAFVVVFATMPFSFEGRRRVEQAKQALAELEEASDALIVFENDRMGQLVLSKAGVQEAFAAADQMIGQSVRAVTTLVTQPGLIRIGMDDLMTALRNTESRCLFGYGSAKGKNRSQEALKRAMKSPLLDGGKMLDRAGSVLVHIAGGESMTLYEVELLMKQLGKSVGDRAQILFGVAVDEQLGESLSVTVISSIGEAAGKEEEAGKAGKAAKAAKATGGGETLPEEEKQGAEAPVSVPGTAGDDGGSDVVSSPVGGLATKKDAGKSGEPEFEPQAEMELLCEEALSGGKKREEPAAAEAPVGARSEEKADTSGDEKGAVGAESGSEGPSMPGAEAAGGEAGEVAEAAEEAAESERAEDGKEGEDSRGQETGTVAAEEAPEQESEERESEESGPQDEPESPEEEESGDDRQGGLRLNILPRVFKRAKGEPRQEDATSVEDAGEEPATATEGGDAGGPEDEGATGEEAGARTSVIASFVDRSKVAKKAPARTAEPEAPAAGLGDGGDREQPVGGAESPLAESAETEPAEVLEASEAGSIGIDLEEDVDHEDQGALALDEGKAGRFVKGEPTIVDGEDLDVPTYLRRKS